MGEGKKESTRWSDFPHRNAQQPPLYVYGGGLHEEYWADWAISSPRYGATTRF